MRHGNAGFSLVELVTVMVIVGIVAAVIMPRFAGRDAFDSRAFYDQAQSVIRYAQKVAIAQQRSIFVCVSAAGISAGPASGCASPMVNPVTGSALSASAPGGVTLSPAGEFSFDGLGRPTAAATITVNSTIADAPARQIAVEAETGYVHD